MTLIQTEMIDILMRLQQVSDENDPTDRAKLLATASRNIATLTRASVNLKRFQSEVKEKQNLQRMRPRKLPVRADCQATQYRHFVARFWGLPP